MAIDRFVGGAAVNAVSALWWAAELTRDGGDYAPTVRALSAPWFAPAWLELGWAGAGVMALEVSWCR